MPGPYARFQDIPSFTRSGNYTVDVPWGSVERTLDELGGPNGVDLDPDFQRGHKWDTRQQERYCEFILRGGRTGRQVLFNQAGWGRRVTAVGPVLLVDGKQRLQAVRRFLRGEILAFGSTFGEFTDKLTLTGPSFSFTVNNLETRAEVLQWYVDLNAGGTVHTDEEIERVREMIAAEAGR